MPTKAKAPPEITATWPKVAALRLARQHLVDRLPADRLLDVVTEHVGIQASNARARGGRAAGRLMIAGVALILGIAGFLFIAAPNSIGP